MPSYVTIEERILRKGRVFMNNEQHSRFQYHVACGKDEKYCYRLYLPKKMERTKKYPVIVFLHGGGGRGTDNESQMKSGEPDQWADLIESGQIEPCVIAVPQQPPQYGFFMESDCVGIVVREIIALYPVDLNRIYLTGISMGSMGCWSETAKYPELFAAFLSVAGVYPDSRYTFPVGGVEPAFPGDVVQIPVPKEESSGAMVRYADILKDFPIRYIHSAADDMAPISYAREMKKDMDAIHASQFTYIEYPEEKNIQHGDTYKTMMQDAENYLWLLRQKRKEEDH